MKFVKVFSGMLALMMVSTGCQFLGIKHLSKGLSQASSQNMNTTSVKSVDPARPVNIVHFVLECKTDKKGYFLMTHGIPSGYKIVALDVAIQENGKWHTLEQDDDYQFWWDDQKVGGMIVFADFQVRPAQNFAHLNLLDHPIRIMVSTVRN